MSPETAPQTTLETVSRPYRTSHQAFSAVSPPRQSRHPRVRLPRFTRAKKSWRPPFVLQERDLDLLRTASEYHLVTTVQYLQLFPDESRDGIYRRLQRLFHHGYLDRLGNNPNAPMLYAITKRGAGSLGVPFRGGTGERYIAHRLMIGNFRIALTLACRQRSLGLTWRDAGELPVRADGFLGLRFPELPEGRNRAFFFLECDRSTMTRERFREKLLRYVAWHDQGGHTDAFGIKKFRVLTVTKSEERFASLLQFAAETDGLPAGLQMFWFTSEKRFTPTRPASIFDPIWETPDRPGSPRSLLP